MYRNKQPNRKSFGIKARIKKIGGKNLKLTLKKQLSEKSLFPKCKYQYTPVLYFLLLKYRIANVLCSRNMQLEAVLFEGNFPQQHRS